MNERKTVTREMQRAGFALIRQRKHQVWRCPCGHAQITMSRSHNEGRGPTNARAWMARTLRECARLGAQVA